MIVECFALVLVLDLWGRRRVRKNMTFSIFFFFFSLNRKEFCGVEEGGEKKKNRRKIEEIVLI